MTRQLFTDIPPAARPDSSMNRHFLRGIAKRPVLRIGIISIDGRIPRYAAQILADIRDSDFSCLHCIIEWPESASLAALTPGRHNPIWRNGSTLLYRGYQQLIEPFQSTDIDPLALVEYRHDRAGDPEPTVFRPLTAQPDALATLVDDIRKLDLDVMINFATPALNRTFASTATHGIWFYRLGHSDRFHQGDDLVRKALEDGANTGNIALVRQTQNNAHAAVLRQACFALVPTLSARKNRFAPYFGSTWFVIEKLAALHATGQVQTIDAVDQARGTIEHEPGNRLIIQHLCRRLKGAVTRSPSRLQQRNITVHWKIALRRSERHLQDEDEATALPQFQWLQSPRGRFWADPFLLEHKGKIWLFFEEYDRCKKKGQIACAEVTANDRIGKVKTVLEKPWHLSYPQIFTFKGEIYMVPESVEHQTVDLYRARHFPYDWVHEKQLLDVAVVDATLQFHGNRWWMFASPMAVPGHAPITCLWHSDSLTGHWQLAPNHLVSHDVQRARNAGAISIHNGNIYRVSQDCAAKYGAALWFNRIVRWDKHQYVEIPEKRFEGRHIPGLTGIHSYNCVGDIEVIDGRFNIELP